ncbi:MAG: DegT/DnrJ/EryC1/StrS family aminotransferase [bacterium]
MTDQVTLQVPPLRVHFPEEDLPVILRQIEGCLRSGQLAQGPWVREFEREFASYVGTSCALATSSGTTALEAVLRGIGVARADVLVPDNTFIATLAAVVAASARPVLADIALLTAAPTVATLEAARTPHTAGVIIVHIGGLISPDLPAIRAWCAQQRLWLVEDASHAHGSALAGQPAGTLGRAAAFSLFATKVITTGEGGIVVTDEADLAERIAILRDHGKPNAHENRHVTLGANWRMSEIHAILGLAQLRRLGEFLAARERIAVRYIAGLQHLGVTVLRPSGRSSWYKFIVLLPEGVEKAKVRVQMREQGVMLPGDVYAIPLHRQPAVAPWARGRYPGAEAFTRRHLCLPIFVGMREEEVDRVVDAFSRSLR